MNSQKLPMIMPVAAPAAPSAPAPQARMKPARRPLRRMNIPALFITDARRAHRITVTVLRAGNPVDLGDTAVSGTVKHLRTGTTIPLSGSAQGSIASVTLPPAAFPGVAHAALVGQDTPEPLKRLRLIWAALRGRI